MQTISNSQVAVAKQQLFDYNPLVLSLIGDGVHTLFVRTMLSFNHPYGINELHTAVCLKVCASAQAIAMKKIIPILNEDENFIYRKCKNAKSNNVPKHASIMDYKYATAFEGIIGYLYLNKQQERLDEIFNLVYGENAGQ
ncbi:MAG TPA: ribonuclease III domain-containing protein [Clostridia bacterium]|nr:ribonuclease III domain-containing protein [Clostridia bacterium]